MSNLLLQKIVLLRVTEVGKIILKKKRPLLLARSVPSPAALEVIILTTSSAASDENLRNCRFCAWAIWKHGHIESPHVNARCWACYCDHPGHSQWSKGCHSTHVTESPIVRSQLLLQI